VSDNPTSAALLDRALPGSWITKHQRIWQMDFLDANKLADLSRARGLSFFEENITELWQLGLLKADIITSNKMHKEPDLIYRGSQSQTEYFIYSDERELPRRIEEWGNAKESLEAFDKNLKLVFHPFRYYVLYQLDKLLRFGVSPMQVFYQNGYNLINSLLLNTLNTFFSSDNFIASINRWNDIASLAIIAEPYIYKEVFQLIKFRHNHGRAIDEQYMTKTRQVVDRYWTQDVQILYQSIGTSVLESIHQELCVATQMLDPNRWIHTLLCLGKSQLRVELEGNLGGALVLRTMAEMIRRATEKAFVVTLREEDEVGLGWVPENIKERLYGSNRLLDDNDAAEAFLRRYDLHYGLHMRFYTEGDTEQAAFDYAFKALGIRGIEIINLGGVVAQKRGKGVAFRDSLLSDINLHVFSIVVIDRERSDFFNPVKKSAADNEICGGFFLAEIDFEFANFTSSELEEIICEIAKDKDHDLAKQDRLGLYKARRSCLARS